MPWPIIFSQSILQSFLWYKYYYYYCCKKKLNQQVNLVIHAKVFQESVQIFAVHCWLQFCLAHEGYRQAEGGPDAIRHLAGFECDGGTVGLLLEMESSQEMLHTFPVGEN